MSEQKETEPIRILVRGELIIEKNGLRVNLGSSGEVIDFYSKKYGKRYIQFATRSNLAMKNCLDEIAADFELMVDSENRSTPSVFKQFAHDCKRLLERILP